jgi:hypothetical protein
MAKLKSCVLGCGGLVSGGGDRHGMGLCNLRSQSSRRQRRARQRGPQAGDQAPVGRGVTQKKSKKDKDKK